MKQPEAEMDIDGARVMRPRWLASKRFAWVGIATSVAMLLGVLGVLITPAWPFGVPWILGFYTCLFSALFAWQRAKRFVRWKRGAVRATEEGLFVGGSVVVPTRKLASATLLPMQRNGAVVRLEERGVFGDLIEVVVPTDYAGRALVAALHKDVTRAPAIATSVPKWWRWILLGYFAGPLSFSQLATSLHPEMAILITTLIPMVTTVLAIVFAFAQRTRVVVGADGISIATISSTRFIPLSRVLGVSIADDERGTVRIHQVVDGREEVVLVTLQRCGITLNPNAADEALALKDRIEEALAHAARGEPSTPEAMLASRPQGTMAEWVLRLRKGRRPETDFRVAGLVDDRLWSTLEDVKAHAWSRAAAAVALSSDEGENARSRLRVLAGATVHPKLRIAIEAAAASDEARMAEALSALDEQRESDEAQSRTL